MHKITSDIMSGKLVTIPHNSTLDEAYGKMRDKKIRHLPVVDDAGRIVGILSDRDLQRAMIPVAGKVEFDEIDFKFDSKFKTQDFMSWPAKTVSESTSVRDVALMMLNEKVSAYLVMGQDHNPIGIVTTDDMLKLLISLLDKDPSRLRLTMGSMFDDYAQTGSFS